MSSSKKLPPSASMSGQNSTYINCTDVGRRSHYGVCLFTIRNFESGKKIGDSDCLRGMRCGSCLAMKMRQEESDAGEALYYTERAFKEPEARPMAKEKPIRSSIWSVVTPKKPKPSEEKSALDFGAGGLSKAITAAVKEEKAMSGLSLLDRVKMKKKEVGV